MYSEYPEGEDDSFSVYVHFVECKKRFCDLFIFYFFSPSPRESGLIWRFLFLCMQQYDLCLRKMHKLRLDTLGELQRFCVIFVPAHYPIHVQRPTWISVHVPIMLYACVHLCLRPDHPSVCSMYVMQCIIQHPASRSYFCPYTSTLVYPSLWLQSISSYPFMNLEGMFKPTTSWRHKVHTSLV